jgi:hypothetical protein
MRYQWKFPDDVCGNGDDMWVHAAVVLFTLYHSYRCVRARRVPLLMFAMLEVLHGYGHYVKQGPWWLWPLLHYTVVANAYCIKPMPLRTFVPFLGVDIIGHLIGNDIISIATTLVFVATRFESRGFKIALAMAFVPFAFIELVACEWSGGHLHEIWDMALAVGMMAGVRWYAT